MDDQKHRVGDYMPPGFPNDDDTAKVLVLTILASRFPSGMSVPELAAELSNDGQDWVERAVRNLSVTDLIRSEGEEVFATFGFPDLRNPEHPGSH